MIVVISSKAGEKEKTAIIEKLTAKGYSVDYIEGTEKILLGAIGENIKNRESVMASLQTMPGVEKVMPILKPYKKVALEFNPQRTIVKLRDDIEIGGDKITIIAGPCAVEGEKEIIETAVALKKLGVQILRAGAFKPRTSPYSFQGFGLKGLKMLAAAGKETGMMVVTEVMEPRQVKQVAQYADILQIGTRNMQNFDLLRECGKSGKPVMLKRGMSATIEEWLLAAEYIVNEGDNDVILCERGIRTFETHTRNTLDLNAVASVKQLSHLPILVDPSHGTGLRDLVAPMARASIAAGADGLIIEAHAHPEQAVSDAQQTLGMKDLSALMKDLRHISKAMGRTL